MSIVVNTNISSINAQRSLNTVGRSLDKALERLASGLRINRAADDAAGLAIADGIQAQVRGLGQAIRNASDGLSVAGTAEGALTTQVGILQRIRELAVQAANDINSAENRNAIQQEIDAQIEELTRLGNTTEFNGLQLLNGTFSNKKLQVGAYASQTISMSIGDFRAYNMGKIATSTGAAVVATVKIATGSLQINGIDVQAAQSDGTSTYEADGSAIAKAAAINAAAGQTGVTATANAATTTSTSALSGTGQITATAKLVINNVTVVEGASDQFTAAAGDSTGVLRNHINAFSNETGVVASLSGSGATAKLVLTAADGRNINMAVTAGTGDLARLGWATSTVNAGGTISLTSNEQFLVQSTSTDMIGFADGTAVAPDPNKAISMVDVTDQTNASEAIQIVDSALKDIADAQASLGAIVNRLENTISNLEVSIENLSASESRIRDADFAKETASLT
ncbi:flagellin, partial [bacterium]|nr:flagellin [bacterium]